MNCSTKFGDSVLTKFFGNKFFMTFRDISYFLQRIKFEFSDENLTNNVKTKTLRFFMILESSDFRLFLDEST